MKYGVETGKDLAEMSLEELRQFSDQIEQDVFAVLTLEGSVNARDHIGGTAPAQVKAAVARGKALLASRPGPVVATGPGNAESTCSQPAGWR